MRFGFTLSALGLVSGLKLKAKELNGIHKIIDLVETLIQENVDTQKAEQATWDKFGCDSKTLLKETMTKIKDNRKIMNDQNEIAVTQQATSNSEQHKIDQANAKIKKAQEDLAAATSFFQKTSNTHNAKSTDENNQITALVAARSAIAKKNNYDDKEKTWSEDDSSGGMVRTNCICDSDDEATKCKKVNELCFDPELPISDENEKQRAYGNKRDITALQNLKEQETEPFPFFLQLDEESVQTVLKTALSKSNVQLSSSEMKTMKSFLQNRVGKSGKGAAKQITGMINTMVDALKDNMDTHNTAVRSATLVFQAAEKLQKSLIAAGQASLQQASENKLAADRARDLAQSQSDAAKKIMEDSDTVMQTMMKQVADSTIAFTHRQSMQKTELDEMRRNVLPVLEMMAPNAAKARSDSGTFLQTKTQTTLSQQASKVLMKVQRTSVNNKRALAGLVSELAQTDPFAGPNGPMEDKRDDEAAADVASGFAPVIATIQDLIVDLKNQQKADEKTKKNCITNIENKEDQLAEDINTGAISAAKADAAEALQINAQKNANTAEEAALQADMDRTQAKNAFEDANNARNQGNQMDQDAKGQYTLALDMLKSLISDLDATAKSNEAERTGRGDNLGTSGQASQQGSTTAQFTGSSGLRTIRDMVKNMLQETTDDLSHAADEQRAADEKHSQVALALTSEINTQHENEEAFMGTATTQGVKMVTENNEVRNQFGEVRQFEECTPGNDGNTCESDRQLKKKQAECKTQIEGLPKRMQKRYSEVDGLETAVKILKGMDA